MSFASKVFQLDKVSECRLLIQLIKDIWAICLDINLDFHKV